MVDGLRRCRCEGRFWGHAARESAHGHDPVPGSARCLRKDISMARSGGCDRGFESCDDAIESVGIPRDSRTWRSLTVLNCLEFVDALCPACRGCARDSRTVDGSFLVFRFLLQIRLRDFLNGLLIFVVVILEAARQASGALGGRLCSSSPLSQNACGHGRTLEM